MRTTTKRFPRLARTICKGLALGTLALITAGCVAEPSPQGYYGYSHDTYYTPPGETTVVTSPDATVIVHNGPPGYVGGPYHNYDDKQEYGRIGNGNYHGEGDDDVHNY